MRKAHYLPPFLALLAMVVACPMPASAARAVPHGDTLRHGDWPHNRSFRAVSLTDHGRPRAIASGTTIVLTFSGHNRVSARAGCNSGSAAVPSKTSTIGSA